MQKLVDTFELEPIDIIDGEPLCFRIEVFADQFNARRSVRVLRWETMRLTPSFPTEGEVFMSDCRILIQDDSYDIDDIVGVTTDAVLRLILERIQSRTGRDVGA